LTFWRKKALVIAIKTGTAKIITKPIVCQPQEAIRTVTAIITTAEVTITVAAANASGKTITRFAITIEVAVSANAEITMAEVRNLPAQVEEICPSSSGTSN